MLQKKICYSFYSRTRLRRTEFKMKDAPESVGIGILSLGNLILSCEIFKFLFSCSIFPFLS